jgi:hypothetical protein
MTEETNPLIPLWAWFVYGFGVISILIGIVNFGMILVAVITVKGISVPLWVIPVVSVFMIALCTATGYLFLRYNIWNRVTSYQNQQTNPEIKELCQNVKDIKKHLGMPP